MQRRAFLQGLLSAPILALWRPRAAQAQADRYVGLSYTDSESTPGLDALKDDDLTTGIEYQP